MALHWYSDASNWFVQSCLQSCQEGEQKLLPCDICYSSPPVQVSAKIFNIINILLLLLIIIVNNNNNNFVISFICVSAGANAAPTSKHWRLKTDPRPVFSRRIHSAPSLWWVSRAVIRACQSQSHLWSTTTIKIITISLITFRRSIWNTCRNSVEIEIFLWAGLNDMFDLWVTILVPL